jgi:hypothetical protein
MAAAGLLALFLSSAGVARAEEPLAPEADTNPSVGPPSSARPTLILVGAAVTAGWYGAAVGTSYLWPNADAASSLRIPVAGPFMYLAKTGCTSRESNCGTLDIVVRTALMSLSAVGQTGGILAMLEGVFVPTSPTPARSRQGSERSVHVAITPGPPGANVSKGLGFEVFGEF